MQYRENKTEAEMLWTLVKNVGGKHYKKKYMKQGTGKKKQRGGSRKTCDRKGEQWCNRRKKHSMERIGTTNSRDEQVERNTEEKINYTMCKYFSIRK